MCVSSQTNVLPNKKYAQLNEVAYGKDELPPLWVDIQESIEDKILSIDQ